MSSFEVRSRTGDPYDFRDGLRVKGVDITGINGGTVIGVKLKSTDTEAIPLQTWIDQIILAIAGTAPTGTPGTTSPTVALDNSSESNANTKFVHDLLTRELAKIIGGAASPYDTLKAISDELAKKPSYGDLQISESSYAIGSGTANAIAATFTPAIAALKDGMVVRVKSGAPNTGAVTFTPNNGTIPFYPVQKGTDIDLVSGDIAHAGYPIWLQWVASASKWQMINPATGVYSGIPANLATILNALAPKSSPQFTDTPRVPTASAITSNEQIANTKFVQDLIASKLANAIVSATESVVGSVSFATLAETVAGILANKVVSPSALKNWFSNLPAASDTSRSTVRLATQMEAFGGTLDNVVMTPKTTKALIEQAISAYSGVSTPPVLPTIATPSTSMAGSSITLNISSAATVSGATISSFALSIDNGAAIMLTAVNNAAVHTWTPTNANGTSIGISVTAMDSNGKFSEVATKTIGIYSVSVVAPTIVAPTSGQTSVAIAPTIQTSAFSVTNGADTHASTEYAIWTGAGRTGTKAFELSTTTDKLNTAVPIDALDHDTLYYVSVRHISATYGPSNWSELSFRTTVQAAAPLATGATSVQIGQNYVLQLASLPQPPATSIVSYTVTVNGGTPNTVPATANAATYTWPSTLTAAQTAGSTAQIEIVFTDNTGAVSKIATKSVGITAIPIPAPNVSVSATGIDKGEVVDISIDDNGFSPTATAITKATVKINNDASIDITTNIGGVYLYTIPSAYTATAADGTVLNIVVTVTDDTGVASLPVTKQIYVNNVKKPVITAPLLNATGVSVTATLTAAAFATFNDVDTHTFTNWRLYDALNVVVWSSLNDTVNKTSIQVPEYTLTGTTDYYLTAEFNGASYGLSGECAKQKFTTMVFSLPAAPTTISTFTVWTNYKSASTITLSGAKVVTGDPIVGFKYWLNGTYVGQTPPSVVGGTSAAIVLWPAGTTVHDNKVLGDKYKLEFATVYTSGAQSAKLTKALVYTGVGKPTFTAPLVTTTTAAITQSLTASAFVSPTNVIDTHASTDFETYTLINGVRTLVFSKYNAAASTSTAHTAGIIKNGLTYVSRVRYKGTAAGWSAWGEVTWSTVKVAAPALTGATAGPLPGATYALTMTPVAITGVGITSFMVSVAGAAAIEVPGTGATVFNLDGAYTTGKLVASTISVTAYTKYDNGSISTTSAAKVITIAGIKTPTISTSAAPTSTTPSFTTAAFAVVGITDTHAMSDFEIWSAAGRTGTLIWSSLNNATNKLSIAVPTGKLTFGKKVYFVARHNGTTYGWSAYKELAVTPTGAAPPPPSGPGGGWSNLAYNNTSNSLTGTYTIIGEPTSVLCQAEVTDSTGATLYSGPLTSSAWNYDIVTNIATLTCTKLFPASYCVPGNTLWLNGIHTTVANPTGGGSGMGYYLP